ncbi:MAG: hypothetical protein AAF892_06880 [Cyanobacteria bacterium P01_D01_bin.71]
MIYYPEGMTVRDTRSHPFIQLPQDFVLPFEGEGPRNQQEVDAFIEAVQNYEGDFFRQNAGPEFIEASFIDIPRDRTSPQTKGIINFSFPSELMPIAELKKPLSDGSPALQRMTHGYPHSVILSEQIEPEQIPYAWARELYVVRSDIIDEENYFPGLVRQAQYFLGEVDGSAFVVSVAVAGLDDSVSADAYPQLLPIEASWERFFPTANSILSNVRKPFA